MKLHFTKMNGAGNDFVILDNRSYTFNLSKQQMAQICDRHRGVGADGLLLVETADTAGADFRMRYYNSDGGEAEMCGNGARCFARFVQKLGACHDRVTFQTLAGVIHAELDGGMVRINLGNPTNLKLREKIRLSRGEVEVSSINTGVPHAIIIVENADQAMVGPLGSEIRHHPRFAPTGTNVNFVQLLNKNTIRIRTYERGVEEETLACGTGVVASALVSHILFGSASPVSVKVQGGDTLEVSFQKKSEGFREVFLKGPADFVFEGSIEI